MGKDYRSIRSDEECAGEQVNRRKAEFPQDDDLEKTHIFFEEILNNCREFIYRRCFAKDEFDYISPYFGELTGYTVDEYRSFKRDDFFALIHPDDHVLLERARSDAMAYNGGRVTQTIEYRIRKKDGGYVWVSDRSLLVKDRDGAPSFVIGNARDITNQVMAQQALHEREKKFRSLFENSKEMVLICDPAGRIIDVNRATEDILGYRKEDIKKMSFEQLHGSPVRQAAFFEEMAANGYVRDFEENLYCKDGTHLDCSMTVVQIKDDAGTVVEYQGIIRDITERKQAEERLQEQKEQYRSIFESVLDGLVVYNFDGTIVQANPAAHKIFGYAPGEMEGLPVRELVPPTQRSNHDERAKKYRVPPFEEPIQGVSAKKDGTSLVIEMKGVEFEYRGQKHALGVFRDITQRKSLEKQLVQAQKMEAIGTLAGGIAHDFNNLLMAIQGHVSLLQLNIDSEHPYRRHFDGIEEMVRRGASLTHQFLAFARGGKYEVTPTDLNELIGKSADLFGRTKKEISFHESYQKEVWVTDIDRGQIEQVLMNIFVNAWQAMPNGGDIYIQTENTVLFDSDTTPYGVHPGNYVKVTVTDTGIGMDEETRQRVFEPFFTTKKMGKGTGLGLASAYGIIKNHEGFISVYSEPGVGTTFAVFLPASSKEIPREKQALQQIVRGVGRIILVDDEEMVIEVGEGMLTNLGIRGFDGKKRSRGNSLGQGESGEDRFGDIGYDYAGNGRRRGLRSTQRDRSTDKNASFNRLQHHGASGRYSEPWMRWISAKAVQCRSVIP